VTREQSTDVFQGSYLHRPLGYATGLRFFARRSSIREQFEVPERRGTVGGLG
jgi:hypothetical protein